LTRTLAIALFCVLAFVPGVLHARICLVALGVIEHSDCCAVRSCCLAEPTDGPSISEGDLGCNCCLDLDLDCDEKMPATVVPSGNEPIAFAAPALSATLPQLLPPPGLERAQRVFARAGPRPRMAAPLPLRI